ncbi:MAG TPA: YceI family protein [Burkholderiaceae bacterium]|nr:YceI family protein [Burkholderiaceae bacterium]
MNRWTISCLAVSITAIWSASTSVTAAALADAGRSQVKFIAQQSGAALEGSFHRFSADVDLDPLHPQGARIKVAIDLASVDAGGTDANNLLKGPDFFDVTRFPSATFVASSVVATGPGTYQATGPFTLKGRTAQLVIAFASRTDETGQWFEGNAPISRLAFGVGQGQWSDVSTLDDEVQIQFKVHLTH